jgi:hypothetical protein
MAMPNEAVFTEEHHELSANALDFASDILGCSFKALNCSSAKEVRDWYLLKVASQNYSSAIYATRHLKEIGLSIFIELDFDYGPDEWSLESRHFFTDGKIDTNIFWSAGA